MTKAVLPGAMLGVLGGGQLGRMFVHAAQTLGYATAVLDPDPASPAGQVAHWHLQCGYLDADGLAQLGQRCAAVTTEFENVPAMALATLALLGRVAPAAAAVAIGQDRVSEKKLFSKAGVPCVRHTVIATADDLDAVASELLPGVLKTARLGYDGKGQIRVVERAALEPAWRQLGQVACVLEQWLPLHRELSVILARTADGTTAVYPVQQNLHRQGVLAVTQVPAPDIDSQTASTALLAAVRVAQHLDYVGVLCVEFFVMADGTLRANEMAPRPHNSGHYSIDACDISQFDLQVRAMAGLPLVSPRQHSAAVMLNLLGDLWFASGPDRAVEPRWAEVLALPGAHLHLYGKAQPRQGRKMGHLTLTGATSEAARQSALQACEILGIAPF